MHTIVKCMGARSSCNILFAAEGSHKLVSPRDCVRQMSRRMGSNLTSLNAVDESHKGREAVPLQVCLAGEV